MGRRKIEAGTENCRKIAIDRATDSNLPAAEQKAKDKQRGARAKQLLRESAMHELPPTSTAANCGAGAMLKLRRYNQYELADMCGYSNTHFNRILNGSAPMDETLAKSIVHAINDINGLQDNDPDAVVWAWLYCLLPDHLKRNRDIQQCDEYTDRITEQYGDYLQARQTRLQWEQVIFRIIEDAADGLGLSAGHTRSGDGPNGETLFVLVDSEDQNKVLVASDLEGFRDALVQQAELLLSGMLVRQQRSERQRKKDAKRKTTPQLCNVANKPNGGATHE